MNNCLVDPDTRGSRRLRLRDVWVEMDFIRELAEKSPERLVTAISGESGDGWISRGFHYVNRHFYLVAKEGVTLPEFTDFRY